MLSKKSLCRLEEAVLSALAAVLASFVLPIALGRAAVPSLLPTLPLPGFQASLGQMQLLLWLTMKDKASQFGVRELTVCGKPGFLWLCPREGTRASGWGTESAVSHGIICAAELIPSPSAQMLLCLLSQQLMVYF